MSVFVDIEKKLGDFHLQVKFSGENEMISLLGASGCGKSMTLKCIAGIEKPDRGVILVDGVPLFDSEKKINLSPQKRRTGLMFQNYALFPNMTVLQNIRAGAKREADAAKREAMLGELIHSFGLEGYLKHYPHQLSGGQQQRVALARLLVSCPNILLLDEPFSALDSHLRFRLEREVQEVLRQFHKTVLLVSHDRDEVYRLSDKVAVMGQGKIDVFGEKKAVFAQPETKNAAILTGCKNISPIKKLGEHRFYAADWGLELTCAQDIGDRAYAGLRMHHLSLTPGENFHRFQVLRELENPFSFTIFLKPEGMDVPGLAWETEKEIWLAHRGSTVALSLPPEEILLLRGSDHEKNCC